MFRKLILFVVAISSLHAESPQTVTWGDLLPQQKEEFDDPFAKLSEEQLLDLGLAVRVRNLLASGKAKPDSATAKEGKELEKKLSEQGIDVDWFLAQRERVAEYRKRSAEEVDTGIDGRAIRIPGYILPLKSEDNNVTSFLLVPWVGACIHTPPPPPNQMIHVSVPGGTENRARFAAMWVEGTIQLKPASYDLFLVDGTRSINVAYTMVADSISEYSANDSDILANVEVPEFETQHSWWQNLQTKVSLMFTKTMTAIKDRKSSGPLWTGLLIAFIYGLVHTLGPGHGKAVVISYFVGEGGSLKRGLAMGIQIAVFHVLSAIIVVWVTDFAIRQATGNAPSDYKAIKMVSYSAIALIGGFMLWKAIKSLKHEHHHSHHHDHHDHGDAEGHGCSACQSLENNKSMSGWLALAVGSVPCTGALLVLLYGMANDLLVPAIFMVVAISAGMAIAISGIGIIAIAGRRAVDKRFAKNSRSHHRLTHGARILGASAVLLIGIALISLTAYFN